MQVIVDTGPLVAFFDRSERYHLWAASRVAELDAPLLVCEPVLAEAMDLFARFPRARDALFNLLQNGALLVAFRNVSTTLRHRVWQFKLAHSALIEWVRPPGGPAASVRLSFSAWAD